MELQFTELLYRDSILWITAFTLGGLAFAFGPIVIVYLLMPVIMGIFGYIFFAIFCAIYNALARKLGGIEVEVTNVD